jgi:hypothetical protein
MGFSAEDDFLISWADLLLQRPCCDLVPLTWQEKSALLSLCRYLEWPTRWIDLPDIPHDFVWGLEHKLMTSCITDLVRSNLLVYGALTGQAVDLTESGIQTLLSTQTPIQHANIGFDKWLNTAEGKTVAITLQEILTAIGEMEGQNYEEVLESIATKVQAIQLVMGFLAV